MFITYNSNYIYTDFIYYIFFTQDIPTLRRNYLYIS